MVQFSDNIIDAVNSSAIFWALPLKWCPNIFHYHIPNNDLLSFIPCNIT